MKNEAAYKALIKLTALYNKNLTDDQYATWLEELKKLNEIAVLKTLRSIKTHKAYEEYMPTVPQFFSIYKTFIQDENIKQPFCYVCNNRGYEILRIYKSINEKSLPYDYFLHCDNCSFGKDQSIKHNGYYSEPISMYFSFDMLIAKNKKKLTKQREQKKENLKEKKELKEVYTALSL